MSETCYGVELIAKGLEETFNCMKLFYTLIVVYTPVHICQNTFYHRLKWVHFTQSYTPIKLTLKGKKKSTVVKENRRPRTWILAFLLTIIPSMDFGKVTSP